VTFAVPARRFGARWELVLATGERSGGDTVGARDVVDVQDRSVTVFRRV
jgi:hypothetical protein